MPLIGSIHPGIGRQAGSLDAGNASADDCDALINHIILRVEKASPHFPSFLRLLRA